jgi:hypothetical protein
MKQRATQPVLPQPASALSDLASASMPPVEGDRAALLADLRRLLPADRLLATPEELFPYECDATIVAMGNPGCLMPIRNGVRAAGLDVKVVHPVELLADAYRRSPG